MATNSDRFRDAIESRLGRVVVEARDLWAPDAVRKFLLTTVREIWPAYLLASILILYGFHWGLPNAYADKSFMADENAAVWATGQIHFPAFNPRWFLFGTGLFYQAYVLKLILTAGGLFHVGDYGMIVIGRVVVFASALGSITLLFWLTRKLFDPWTARLAAIILAVLPGFVIGSHYFKTDMPMLFWMLAAMLTAYQLIDSGNLRYVLLLGVLVGYAASIKYSAIALVPVGCVALGLASARSNKRFSWIWYAGGIGLGFAVGEPAVLVPRGFQAIIIALRTFESINRQGQAFKVVRPPGWIDYPLNVFPYSFTVPVLILSVVAVLWIVFRRPLRQFLPVLTFLVGYWLLLGSDNERFMRYSIPMLPFAALFVAALAGALRERRIVGPLVQGAVFAAVGYAFLFSLSYVKVMAEIDPRIQASRWIEENVPRNQPIPELHTHYLNHPQLAMIGYQGVDIDYSIPQTQAAESPYVIVSEFSTREYLPAIDYYPQQKAYFQFLSEYYTEAAHFENSQKLLFIDSKSGDKLPQDWLLPNPRVTILVRAVKAQAAGVNGRRDRLAAP